MKLLINLSNKMEEDKPGIGNTTFTIKLNKDQFCNKELLEPKIIVEVDGKKYWMDNSTWLKEVEWLNTNKWKGQDDDNITSQGHED